MLTGSQLYLHVLSTNKAAIKFYKKNLFVELRYLSDFYHFDSANHAAFLYVLYLNGAGAPYPVRVWNSTRYEHPVPLVLYCV